MRIFLAGEIQEEKRGTLAAILCREDNGTRRGGVVCAINSQEFEYVTGEKTKDFPIERVYLGINQTTGKEILRITENLDEDPERKLRELDHLIVIPYFLASKKE